MKFGLRVPSLKRRIAARTSWKRVIRHNLGLKAPSGMGIITNSKEAIYNRIYNKTSISMGNLSSIRTRSSSSGKSSIWISSGIFIILSIISMPIGIGYLAYKLYKHHHKDADKKVATATNASDELIESLKIPEPTRSLLWITNENTSKISSPMGIKISFNFNNGTANVDDGHNFYGEPSLIWTQLAVEQNAELEDRPMYFPSYSGLSPAHRYQYLNWLRDVTQKTNLSYVFLYYYGLERHMLVGKYDAAVDEILRLLKHHAKGSFVGYATTALIGASAYRKRPEIVNKAPILLQEVTNESLILRRLARKSLTAKDVISLASKVGYSNKRYIKLYPQLFEETLDKNISIYESRNGNILTNIDTDILPKRLSTFFANTSLPNDIRAKEIPDLISSVDLSNVLRELLSSTHNEVKKMKTNPTTKLIAA